MGSASRRRFVISKYAAESGHTVYNNFLSPEHEFEVNLSSVISRDSGTTVGGKSVGVWIHTKPENGKMWSFTPDGEWVQHDQLISRSNMLAKYAHTQQVATRPNDPHSTSSTSTFSCLEHGSQNRTYPVIDLGPDDFDNLRVTFNSRTRDL